MRPFRPTSTPPSGGSLRAFGRDRDGGIAVTVAVMTAVLVGVLVLSIDAARLYNASTERNNAADAAAVAAATQLDGGTNACRRAIDAAVNANLLNQETFVSNRTGPDVYISPVGGVGDAGLPTSNPNIKFLSELIKDDDGNVIDTYITDPADCDEEASFVEVTTNLVAGDECDDDSTADCARVDYYFAGLVGALTQAFPRGYAIAEYAKGYCNVPPMMMCALAQGEGIGFDTPQDFWNAIATYQLTGRGLLLKSGTNSTQWGSGNFGFLRLDGAGGAKALGELIGSVAGNKECVGFSEVETEPGNNSGARWAFNTRFDMYHGSMSGNKGEAAWQPAANTIKGLVRDGSSCGWGGGGYGDPPNTYNGLPVATMPEAMPFPMDKCAYGGAGTCAAIDNLGRLGDGDWDRETYFEVNHQPPTSLEAFEYNPYVGPNELLTGGVTYPSTGAAGCTENFAFEDADYDYDPGTGMNPSALHPDCSMSRYEAYLWELGRLFHNENYASMGDDHATHLVNNTGSAGYGTIPQIGEHGGENTLAGPQCYDGDLGDYALGGETIEVERDRRVVQALVVNCDPDEGGVEIKGKTKIPLDDPNVILGTIELFVLEPWQVNGGEHQISTEIIGPGELDEDYKPKLVREWINLKESRKY